MAYTIRDGCTGCGACMANCTHDAIKKDREACRIDPYRCEECGSCKKICPFKLIKAPGESQRKLGAA